MAMAWRPYFERLVEIDSAEERANFMRGVTGFPAPNFKTTAAFAVAGLLIGWGSRNPYLRDDKKK
jgi:hypothetical protein